VLGLGLQPGTAATARFMTPKPHYRALHRALGKPWLWFTVSASDQLHVEIGRSEIVDQFNMLNALVPVTIALCGNSPISQARDTGAPCFRELRMAQLLRERDRYGMLDTHPHQVGDLIDHILGTEFLVRAEQGSYEVVGQPFWSWLLAESPGLEHAFRSFSFHDHYNWHSCRPRMATGTIELRAACQQPHQEHMAAAALHLGMVEAAASLAPILERELKTRGLPYLYRTTLTRGLDLDSDVLAAIGSLLDRCAMALRRRQAGEERFLEPLYRRLAARENPGQRAASVFRRDGLAGLLAHAAHRIPSGMRAP
jgi:glutamate--cysteine ligase